MFRTAAFSLALALVAGAAQAAVVSYNDRASFEAATGGVTVESFNSFVSDTSFSPGPLDVGAFTLANVGTDFDQRNYIDVPPLQFAEQDINGTAVMSVFTSSVNDLVFTFASAITAFGADFVGLNDLPFNGGPRTQMLLDGVLVTLPTVDNVGFFGVISDTPFTTVTFEGIANSGYGIDDVTFAATAAVPEPMSLALLALGAAGLMLRRRAAG